ncbi:MAG: hypothetical protein LBQ77_01825 [Treponema sp.]|jgi:hypothetical protein|nr:hypothetical protein [Treponema sp.]
MLTVQRKHGTSTVPKRRNSFPFRREKSTVLPNITAVHKPVLCAYQRVQTYIAMYDPLREADISLNVHNCTIIPYRIYLPYDYLQPV